MVEQMKESQVFYDLPIVAEDSGGRLGFTTLRIAILDVNDNEPEFELSEYKASVPSNFSLVDPILIVSAEDADAGANADLTYTIYEEDDNEVLYKRNSNMTDASRVFEINSKSGAIRLRKPALGLENQVYQFFVRAQDRGSFVRRHADVPVEIYIMSPLDSAPEFEIRDAVYYVRENSAVGKSIVKMKAELTGGLRSSFELDGINEEEAGVIRYKIANKGYEEEDDDNDELTVDDKPFVIDPEDGSLSVNGILDRERRSIYKLKILAETDSSPALVAYADVTVQVLDVNDESPVFKSDPYKISVSEATPADSKLIQVFAEDKDYGNNGEVRYSLEADLNSQEVLNIFHVDPHDGWIKLQGRQLDYEKAKRHTIHVTATDNGEPKRSTAATVEVKVVDDNDNPPKFSQRHYNAAVNEGALPGTIIFQLETEDEDEMTSDVAFMILDGDPLGQFQVRTTLTHF